MPSIGRLWMCDRLHQFDAVAEGIARVEMVEPFKRLVVNDIDAHFAETLHE